MKKKKTQNVEPKETEGHKPWMLLDIAPEVRKVAKDSAQKHNVKVAEWVSYAIIKTWEGAQSGEDDTIDKRTFAEMMEELPDREFMRNSFISLRGKIDELSQKIDGTYKPSVQDKPWWKFW